MLTITEPAATAIRTLVSSADLPEFLAPAAAEVLEDKVLDVEQISDDDNGQAQLRFAVAPQDPGI